MMEVLQGGELDMLFAEDEVQTGILVVIASILGGAVTWLARESYKWVVDKRVYEQEVKRDALKEAYKLIDRLRKDVDDNQVKFHDTTRRLESKLEAVEADHRACLIRYERAITQIEYMKDALNRNNIPFKVLTDMDGSHEHKPLPPGDDR